VRSSPMFARLKEIRKAARLHVHAFDNHTKRLIP